jgi:CDP-glucose 4,6-dehydratase
MGIGKSSVENLVVTGLFNNAYQGRKVLVTGHTGFKGSWLVAWLKMMGATVVGYALPPETSPNHYDLLNLTLDATLGDINDRDKLQLLIEKTRPEIVFHLAAQSLVRRSYRSPYSTYLTNVLGTLNVYEVCLGSTSVKSIISITSDKVYENIETDRPYRETDLLGGHDMYSSSKACVELMTNSFRRSFLKDGGVQLMTVRAGNVVGGGDWAEDRLIPDIMKALVKGDNVMIRRPNAVRPWQHVLEPLSGYLLLGQKLIEGLTFERKSWNFGPDNEARFSVRALAELLKDILPEIEVRMDQEGSHPHEAGILTVDSSNSRDLLGWRPVWDTTTGIIKTAEWYKAHMMSQEILTYDQISAYVADAGKSGLSWATK